MSDYILSYPRSGNHLVRGLVEYLTKKPTNGCLTNPEDTTIQSRLENVSTDFQGISGNPEWTKAHDPMEELKNVTHRSKLILIVRDPLEALPSHLKTTKDDMLSNLKPYSKHHDWYVNILNRFQIWTGPKLLLYYEDLVFDQVEHHTTCVKQLGEFLQVSPDLIDSCIQNWETITSLTKNVALQRKSESDSINYYKTKFGLQTFLAPQNVYSFLQRYGHVQSFDPAMHPRPPPPPQQKPRPPPKQKPTMKRTGPAVRRRPLLVRGRPARK